MFILFIVTCILGQGLSSHQRLFLPWLYLGIAVAFHDLQDITSKLMRKCGVRRAQAVVVSKSNHLYVWGIYSCNDTLNYIFDCQTQFIRMNEASFLPYVKQASIVNILISLERVGISFMGIGGTKYLSQFKVMRSDEQPYFRSFVANPP